jgi:two-component system KDP operon response regulator KdpE
MKRALVVDDDPQIRRAVREALAREGIEVETAADGEEALRRAAEVDFSLVITDLSMPKLDGLELVRALRRRSAVPVLVLTVRSEEREKVRLLDAGADDYVVKPFGIAELLARARALLRRNAAGAPETQVRFGEIAIDLDRQRVTRGGAEVHLSPTEFALLRTFVGKPGAVWTHRQLIGAVWGGGAGVSNDTVRVHMGSLRRKLEQDPNRPRFFITEPWVGYRFTGSD